jgi:hypothetical protein
MTDLTQLGQAGLQGWRKRVGDLVASPVAQRAPVSEDQVRALLGAVFFALSVSYVVKTARQVATRLRS